jgi:predicted XRE-type DNA-binding protein
VGNERGYETSSGNVFADLGHPDPATALAKAQLARQIGAIIAQHGWTQSQAAAVLGIDQPKVSALVRGRLRDFSAERLMHFLTRLGYDIEIGVMQTPSPDRPGQIAVSGEAEPVAASSK